MRIRYLLVFLLFCGIRGLADDMTDKSRELLDQIRSQSGIAAKFEQHALLDLAARKHCLYWAENFDWLNPLKKQGLLNYHHQVRSVDDGIVNLIDNGSLTRVQQEGYLFEITENVAQGDYDHRVVIHQLMASLGHRLKFLKANMADFGFHYCRIQTANPVIGDGFFVYLMGGKEDRIKRETLDALCKSKGTNVCPVSARDCSNGFKCKNGLVVLAEWLIPEVEKQFKPQTEGIVVYPGDGSVGVMPVAQNVRKYDPERKDERGTIISVEFLPDTLRQLSDEPVASLKDQKGIPVLLQQIESECLGKARPGLRAWFAEQALDSKANYQLEIRYTLDEEEQVISSHFTTYSAGEGVIKVTERNQSFKVEEGSVVTLIFSRDVFSTEEVGRLRSFRSKSTRCTIDCPATRSVEFTDNRFTMEFHGDVHLFSAGSDINVVITMK